MDCRFGCGACCIAPSISSSIPGMEQGKPARTRCIQLDDYNLCKLFQDIRRPAVCCSLPPSNEMCGTNEKEAYDYLSLLEDLTS